MGTKHTHSMPIKATIAFLTMLTAGGFSGCSSIQNNSSYQDMRGLVGSVDQERASNIKTLQRLLNQGHYTDDSGSPLREDGRDNSNTIEAFEKFLDAYGRENSEIMRDTGGKIDRGSKQVVGVVRKFVDDKHPKPETPGK